MKLIRISAIWCSSCILTYKYFKELQELKPEIEYLEYDYDMDDEVVSKYQVGNILPVVIALNENNREVSRLVGEKNKKELLEWVAKIGDNHEEN